MQTNKTKLLDKQQKLVYPLKKELKKMRHMKQKGLDTSSIKVKNRQTLYKFIHSNDGVSRQDIARELRLSLPTVISNIEYLQENNLIDFSDEMQSTGGRKASTYVIKKRTRMAVGLYLTKHHIHAVTVDLAGNVVNSQEKEILFNLDDDAYLQELAASVEYVRAKSNIKKEELLGVGSSYWRKHELYRKDERPDNKIYRV